MITKELLSDLVDRAINRGATDAEALGSETTEFSVEIRMGQIEKLEEAASRGLGLRVLFRGRQASCSTSDVTSEAIDELITTAVEMAKLTSVDESAMLPVRDELAKSVPDLSLYDAAISEMTTTRKIEMARICEDAARTFDPRITNSEGSTCTTRESSFS